MVTFPKAPVAREAFAQIRVELAPVPFIFAAAKADRFQARYVVGSAVSGWVRQKFALAALHLSAHHRHRNNIPSRLHANEAHVFVVEVRMYVEAIYQALADEARVGNMA